MMSLLAWLVAAALGAWSSFSHLEVRSGVDVALRRNATAGLALMFLGLALIL